MKYGKRLAAALAALALAASLAACGGEQAPAGQTPTGEGPASESPASESPTGESPTGEAGLTVCVAAEPESIDPALSGSDGGMVVCHLFEGLMKWADSGAALDGDGRVDRAQLTYGQAEGYDQEENDDGTVTYTFHLRADARWSDGKPVTAQDFAYAWRRLVDPATGAERSDLLDCVVNARDIRAGAKEPGELAVRAVDDATFQVTVQDAPEFIQLCALPATCPVRQDAVEQAPEEWAHDPETCISNGMYRLDAWEHYVQIALTPNEEYYDPDAQAAQAITFQLSDDDSAIQAAFDSGTLDFAVTSSATGADDEGTADRAGTYFACFQTQKAPFDDARVREAFTLAVDRAALTQAVQGGLQEAGGYIPHGISDADGPTGKDFRAVGGDEVDPGADAYEENCRRARQLLAEAGYPDGAGFPETTYLYNTGETHQAVAQALQDMWQEALGVAVTLDGKPWAAYLQARRAGEFSIARGSWTADYDDPASFLALWRSDSGGNAAGYENADYDDLLDAAERAADPGERMELLHQAEELLVGQDYVLCPLAFYTRTYRMREGLQGVYYTPLGYFFFHAAVRR